MTSSSTRCAPCSSHSARSALQVAGSRRPDAARADDRLGEDGGHLRRELLEDGAHRVEVVLVDLHDVADAGPNPSRLSGRPVSAVPP
jgi:hypothetical protein